MAHWIRCPDCGGYGKVHCWLCDGAGEDDDGETCRECYGDKTEPCETCDTEGGWYSDE